MTTPSKAQIEAAAKAIREMLATVGSPTPENFAYVALTAAAQVAEPDQNALARYIRTINRSVEDRTIERCAQVAEQTDRTFGKRVGLEIAAAIRRLKDDVPA
jgi:hypothetical protein